MDENDELKLSIKARDDQIRALQKKVELMEEGVYPKVVRKSADENMKERQLQFKIQELTKKINAVCLLIEKNKTLNDNIGIVQTYSDVGEVVYKLKRESALKHDPKSGRTELKRWND